MRQMTCECPICGALSLVMRSHIWMAGASHADADRFRFRPCQSDAHPGLMSLYMDEHRELERLEDYPSLSDYKRLAQRAMDELEKTR